MNGSHSIWIKPSGTFDRPPPRELRGVYEYMSRPLPAGINISHPDFNGRVAVVLAIALVTELRCRLLNQKSAAINTMTCHRYCEPIP